MQTVLQEHTKQGEVILLVYRGGRASSLKESVMDKESLAKFACCFLSWSGTYHSSISPGSVRRLPPPQLQPPPPPVGSDCASLLPETLPMPRTSTGPPPSPAPTRSSLIQSTSFLESIPVTLTMEPKDWINTGLEDEAGATTFPNSTLDRQGGLRSRPLRGFDVELRRKPGEGFGFVIASQDVKNGKGERISPAGVVRHSHRNIPGPRELLERP